MKKLKLVLFSGVVMALMVSCNENGVVPNSVDQNSSMSQGTSNSSSSQIPATVQSTLATSFPSARNTSWSKVAPDVYQASFSDSSRPVAASIRATGELLYSHSLIDITALPATIISYLNGKYSGYVIKKSGVKNNSSGVPESYMVELTVGNKLYEILFDTNASVLSLFTLEIGSETSTPEVGYGSGTPVNQADLLASITTYLASNYPGYTFVGAASFSDSSQLLGYGVKIIYQGKTYKVEFDSVGSFIKAG